MAITKPIVGKFVDLISCTEADADFTREIRKDPEFVKYLPLINNTLDQQKAWIRSQREKRGDYFFVVWNKKQERIGTISIFDIFENPPKAGRLALKGNAFENIEAQYLSFDFAFNTLNIDKLWGFIYEENHRAIRFAETFGVTLFEPREYTDGRLIREVYFYKDDFRERIPQIEKMIYRRLK